MDASIADERRFLKQQRKKSVSSAFENPRHPRSNFSKQFQHLNSYLRQTVNKKPRQMQCASAGVLNQKLFS